MNRKNLIISLLSVIITLSYSSFTKPDESKELKWLSFEEALVLQAKAPKKILIDVYTDWCGWCKKMDKNTYTDPNIIQYLNKHFYIVKLDAEQKADIQYKEKTFKFKPEYKAHELAVSLLNGQMSYPSTVFLDEEMNMLTNVPGYLKAEDLQPILKYFGENIYKEKNWKEYETNMNN